MATKAGYIPEQVSKLRFVEYTPPKSQKVCETDISIVF